MSDREELENIEAELERLARKSEDAFLRRCGAEERVLEALRKTLRDLMRVALLGAPEGEVN